KIRLGVIGRRESFNKIQSLVNENDKVIWAHCSSLGEYEQGLPVFKMLKEKYTDHKIILTFLSPSGYEVKKASSIADLVIYLPIDSNRNAEKFITTINPKLVVFVKNEIWPNYIKYIKKYNIKSALICGIFREGQLKFSWPFNFLSNSILKFDYILVQNEESKKIIQNLGHNNTYLCGDTRFDRVYETINKDESIEFIEEFKGNKLCLVAGSIWEEDQRILVNYINSCEQGLKFILVPHEINKQKISKLRESISQTSTLYSEFSKKNNNSNVLIIDNVGILARLYKYADMAYIGGGMGTSGLHNTLEAAAFGIPIIIGKNYSKFSEAKKMISLGGMFSVKNNQEFKDYVDNLTENKLAADKIGLINSSFILENKGATKKIMNYL
ncbi:MAG TPA: glycosyltransferase N-terminal domain-containing protein, partial [Flavobacteriaceae bacterium]|nr:glycosyltransferase N-terminal domain-containing protein [Flavobacteriaceae bacterium]